MTFPTIPIAREVLERAFVQNVGWLSARHPFDQQEPSQTLLDVLWAFCMVFVHQARGVHICELCSSREWVREEKDGIRLSLGSAEIRVFSKDAVIYASPNLIYHYVSAHHYKPPDVFVSALMDGLRPPMRVYFDELRKHGYEWTSRP